MRPQVLHILYFVVGPHPHDLSRLAPLARREGTVRPSRRVGPLDGAGHPTVR